MTKNELKNKTILITGGTGTVGSELVRQILTFKPKQVRVLSRDESKQYCLVEDLKYPKNLRLLIGDIRDKERLLQACRGADIIFHAAAMKHVPLCEYNPFEAVKTNIIGTQNLIKAAIKNEVGKVIAVSTDKAVNPVGIMGTTKLMMERLIVNANYVNGKIKTKFSCVRFGNVAAARGSVLDLWRKQVARDNTIKITDGNMTRFFMSPAQSIELVLEAESLMTGGEIFIFKMPAIKLNDMAEIFLKKHFPNNNVRIQIIGNRTGEKQHEELLNPTNGNEYILENKKMYAIIPKMPIFNIRQAQKSLPGFRHVTEVKTYSSKEYIDKKKIAQII